MTQTFAAPVVIRFERKRHVVLYTSEAGAILLTWPLRKRHTHACRRALNAIVAALESPTPQAVEEARVAFRAACKQAGVLEPS